MAGRAGLLRLRTDARPGTGGRIVVTGTQRESGRDGPLGPGRASGALKAYQAGVIDYTVTDPGRGTSRPDEEISVQRASPGARLRRMTGVRLR
jgi:hypothetical protein